MKILVTEHEDFVELVIRDDSGINLHCYTFEDKDAHKAFIQGMACMKSLCNAAVQSIPTEYQKFQSKNFSA